MAHSHGVFAGEARLVLESVGTADAAALRAIRQLVPGAIQDAARLVYQAPSELRSGLRPDAAAEMQGLLERLGFRVSVRDSDAAFHAGVGQFEIALVVRDMNVIGAFIAEAASFLGTDLPTARRLVCRSPAVLVSRVSEATVAVVRDRFGRLGVEVDVSRSSLARYCAVIAADNPAVRRAVLSVVQDIASDAVVIETTAALIVENFSFDAAEACWERLRRTGARVSICNRDFERYDVSLDEAPNTPAVRELLVGAGVPARLIDRVLRNVPVIVQRHVSHAEMQTLLDRAAGAGALASALPHSFQRFAIILRSIKDAANAARLLVTLGDMSEGAAASAVATVNTPIGNFPRTTALWLQHLLATQGCDAAIEVL